MPLGAAVTQELFLKFASIRFHQALSPEKGEFEAQHWDIRGGKVKHRDTHQLRAYEKQIATSENMGTNLLANKMLQELLKILQNRSKDLTGSLLFPLRAQQPYGELDWWRLGCEGDQEVKEVGTWKWQQPHQAAWATWSQHGEAIATDCFCLLGFNESRVFPHTVEDHIPVCVTVFNFPLLLRKPQQRPLLMFSNWISLNLQPTIKTMLQQIVTAYIQNRCNLWKTCWHPNTVFAHRALRNMGLVNSRALGFQVCFSEQEISQKPNRNVDNTH